LAILLALITLLTYLNAVTTPFIFDDRKWIVDTPQVRNLSNDWRRLDPSKRPVPALTLALNYQWGHLDVRGYHVVNVVVHIVAGLLLFGIVRRTIKLHDGLRQVPAAGLAFAIALTWLVHPLQTESVTYVIQRCESMMGMFLLLCLYCVLRGAGASRGWPWYFAALVACVLGLGCKEVMATAPAVILLYDRVFLSRSWREVLERRGWLYALMFGAVLALIVLLWPTIVGRQDASVGFSNSNLTAWVYLRTQAGVLLHYLRLSVWPRPQCLDYDWQPAQSLAEILPAAAIIVSLFAGSMIAYCYRPWLGFLGTTFFILLAPTSSIVPIKDLAVEHRMYLPLAAVLAVLVVGWYGLTERCLTDPNARRLARVAPATLAVLLFMGLTVQRNADYGDAVRMWSQVVAVAPHNARGHFSLGASYNLRGEWQHARQHFQRALALNPNYARAHANLGWLLIRHGELERGEDHLQRALELTPNYPTALVNMGNLQARQQHWRQALDYYRRAVEAEPYLTVSRRNMASTLLRLGKPREAAVQLREAMRLNPHAEEVRLQLAWILATCADADVRDGREALHLAETLRRQVGDGNRRLLDVIAAAYAELGRYAEASDLASRCADLAQADGRQEEVEVFLSRLRAYRDKRPFREDLNKATFAAEGVGSDE